MQKIDDELRDNVGKINDCGNFSAILMTKIMRLI